MRNLEAAAAFAVVNHFYNAIKTEITPRNAGVHVYVFISCDIYTSVCGNYSDNNAFSQIFINRPFLTCNDR